MGGAMSPASTMGAFIMTDQSGPRRRDIQDKVCTELEGGRTLLSICRADGMPPASAVVAWVRQDPDGFGARYRAARQIGYHLMADEMIDIADQADRVSRSGDAEGGSEAARLARDKLRIECRRWVLARVLPDRDADPVTPAVQTPAERMGEIMRAIDGKTRVLVPRN
jgi:hypothetical protein